MRDWVSQVVWLAGVLAALAPDGGAGTRRGPSDQRIIVLKAGANPAIVARRHGLVVGSVFDRSLKGFVGRVPTSRLKHLRADPDVALVEQDLVAHTCVQTLPTGVSRIDTPLNSYAKIDGKDDRVNVDIAIIDTGIDLKHPDLNVAYNKSFISGETSGQDGNGHGTHVAGIAAAIDNGSGVVGVAPGARLWALKVLDKNGSGYISDIIKALDFVAANSTKIAVVNMSLGGQGKLDSFRQAIQNCVNHGVVVVVAAGNESRDIYGPDRTFGTSDDSIPAAYPEVAAVSALCDTDGKRGGLGPKSSLGYADDTFAGFTNFSRYVVSSNPVTSPGGAIDLAAPGVDIRSTYRGSTYATLSGTSMSSPHVTGAVALYIAQKGRAKNAAGVAAIRQALINAAQAQTKWGPANTGDPDSKREGCVNVASGTTPPPNNPPTVTIAQPKNGSSFDAGTAIGFSGTASDSEDGSLTAKIAWSSSLDGALGTGGSVSKVLSTGTHTITASVTDSGGKSASASVTLTVLPPSNNPPTVAISEPQDGGTYDEGVAIPFSGTASDPEDGSLTAKIAWTSSLDGALGTGGSFSKTLSPGTHTITASVTDSGGKKASASVTLTVRPSGGGSTQLVVTVTTDKTLYGWWETPIISVLVTDGVTPVAGADVTIALLTASGRWLTAQGTSEADGFYRVMYLPWPPRDGYGYFYAFAYASMPGYTDGQGMSYFLLWW